MPTPTQTKSTTGAFQHDTPNQAIRVWLDRINPIDRTETLDWEKVSGRILAEPIRSDRPSPPMSNSAMDGYAMRLADMDRDNPHMPVVGEIPIGHPAPTLPPGSALHIVTGAVVPDEADVVIIREHVEEHDDHIVLSDKAFKASKGANIRYAGENIDSSQELLPIGTLITPAVLGAIAGFGYQKIRVYEKLRTAIITTGDEVLSVESKPEPWQIRNTNGPALHSMLATCPWIDPLPPQHIADDLDHLRKSIEQSLDQCDALILTGGVSMGNKDHVPAAVLATGAEQVFHKMPVRPGKPVFAAVSQHGQPIMGLPGNPVSVMVAGRRTGTPILARRAGVGNPAITPSTTVTLNETDGKTLRLWWYRPVKLATDDTSTGSAQLVQSRGSGDFVNTALSDGFIEVPPHTDTCGPWPFWNWSITS